MVLAVAASSNSDPVLNGKHLSALLLPRLHSQGGVRQETSNKSSDPLRFSVLVWTLLRFSEHSCAGRAACERRCWCLRRPARPASCCPAGEATAAHARSASRSRSAARTAAAPPSTRRRRRPHSPPPILTLWMYRMATRRTQDSPSGAPSAARQRARARACQGLARRRGHRATTLGCKCCATCCTTRRRRGAASAAVRAGPCHGAYVPPTPVFTPQALLQPSGSPLLRAHAGALPRRWPARPAREFVQLPGAA